ncbi:hypothetical protein C8J57DRAFT_1528235 [Mycena rebaudengoi]|nr:hypothetical protein C8J57DRAFT_1528235 [Mycena rebaudengoi]
MLQIISRFDRTAPGSTRTPPHAAASSSRFPPWPPPGSPADEPPSRQPPHMTMTTLGPPPPRPPKSRTLLHLCLHRAAYITLGRCIARYSNSNSVTAFTSSGASQVNGWWHALYAEDRVRMFMISADPGSSENA